jgi:Krev interaction trapped protein 1
MNTDGIDRDDNSLSMLYVLPTSQADTTFIEKIPDGSFKLKFYCLHDTLRKAVRSEVVTTPATKTMLSSIDKWLREQHSIPYALQSMFLGSIRQRLKAAVISPLFMRQKSSQTIMSADNGTGGGEEEEEGTYVEIGWQPTVWTEDALKLPDIKPKDRANLYFVNTLFGTGVQPMRRVKVLVVNKYFASGVIPNYSKIKIERKKKKWEIEIPSDGRPDWVDEFPLHRAACEGTVVGVLSLISEGYDANQPDTDSWTPLHYAAWYGYGPVVKALIAEGKAGLTTVNENGSTALHLAASTGRPEVVHILLQNSSVNKDARDNEGRSPVDLCEECKMNDWEVAVMLLKGEAVDIGHAYRVAASAAAAMGKGAAAVKTRRYQKLADKTEKKVKVNLLDRTEKVFALEKGNESTTNDILEYLYKDLNLSAEAHSIFGLWIMSPSLQWELSEDHKVISHIRQWPQLIDQLTDGDPENETPTLCLKRTCILPKSYERKIKDMTAIHLLFVEAQHLVLSSQYPCNEEDAAYLGGIAMQVAFGNHNEELHKPGCLRDSLDKFIPAALINMKNAADLEERVLQEHADISRRELDDVKLLYLLYLQQCRQWPFYGSTFFTGNIQPKVQTHRQTERQTDLDMQTNI